MYMDAGAATLESAVLPQRTSVKTVGLFAKKWRLTTWGLVVLVSSFIGLFFAAQMHYSSAAFGRPVSWGQALYWALGDWYEWAILSPVIFWVSRRFSFERQLSRQRSRIFGNAARYSDYLFHLSVRTKRTQ